MAQDNRKGRRAVVGWHMALVTLLAASACYTEAEVHPHTLPLGPWGGTDISFTATETGATLQYSCGTGKINPPLTLDGDGNFSWTGTTKHVGGAPPTGQPEPDVATTFTGVATLSTIILRVTPVGQPQAELVFNLMRGSPGVVYGCP